MEGGGRMSRLIDADALLKGKDDHQIISTHLIWNAPTVDAVQVVRCEECRYWESAKDPDDGGRCMANGFQLTDREWYCADGERKDG